MKKIITVLLGLLILLSLTSCDELLQSFSAQISAGIIDKAPTGTDRGTPSNDPKEEDRHPTPSEDDHENLTDAPSPTETDKIADADNDGIPDNEMTPPGEDHENEISTESATTESLPPIASDTSVPPTDGDHSSSPSASHVALSPDEYLQYTHLSLAEKQAYDRIRVAVYLYDNVVNVLDLALPEERIVPIIDCFIADNPQCFWVAPMYGYTTENGVPKTISLQYTDGTSTDTSEEALADRSLIDQRRAQVERTVSAILASIDPLLTDYEKELYIHDYLTANIYQTVCRVLV